MQQRWDELQPDQKSKFEMHVINEINAPQKESLSPYKKDDSTLMVFEQG